MGTPTRIISMLLIGPLPCHQVPPVSLPVTRSGSPAAQTPALDHDSMDHETQHPLLSKPGPSRVVKHVAVPRASKIQHPYFLFGLLLKFKAGSNVGFLVSPHHLLAPLRGLRCQGNCC